MERAQAPSSSNFTVPPPSVVPMSLSKLPQPSAVGLKRKSREEIESAAKKQGAKGG